MSSAPALLRFAADLGRAADEYEAAALVADGAAEFFDAAFAGIYLIRFDGATEPAAAAGPERPPAPALEALATLAIERGAIVQAGPAELRSLDLESARAVAIASPLPLDEPAVAALVLVRTGADATPDRELLDAMADLAGSSIANVRRLREAYAEARIDTLSGLGNRRAFDEHMDALIPDEDSAVEDDVTLIVFDVDDFKVVNDKHGHVAGDDVLRRVARTLLSSVRTTDAIFRIGGDEFAVLIEGERELGLRIALRLRRAVAAQRRGFRLPTLSAGIASFPEDAGSKPDLLRRADLALYAAKTAGKNSATLYTPQLESTAPAWLD